LPSIERSEKTLIISTKRSAEKLKTIKKFENHHFLPLENLATLIENYFCNLHDICDGFINYISLDETLHNEKTPIKSLPDEIKAIPPSIKHHLTEPKPTQTKNISPNLKHRESDEFKAFREECKSEIINAIKREFGYYSNTNFDSIALCCTHFIFAKNIFLEIFKDAKIYQMENIVAEKLKLTLENNN
jgi:hypothetical protein